jgi:alkylation response protein AidB-like acyl-CoA dehydrogenase
MEFAFPEEAEEFRKELRAFIEAELPDWWTSMFAHDPRVFPFARRFCAKLAERGWLTMAWPKEFGGEDADVWMQMVVREEMWRAGEPRGPQYLNLNFIGPAIMMFGTPEQHERFLKPMAAGQHNWCQGFSEPGSGSDLASLQSKAVPDGDGYVIQGQKIWTSYATDADWCLFLARTDPDSPAHKGLSMFLVDMTTPGITVRPIDSMGGPVEFNETFWDAVRVPGDCLLGPLNEGWRVAMGALAYERAGIAIHAGMGKALEHLVAHVRADRRLSRRPAVRAKLARLHAMQRAAQLLNYRVIANQTEGRPVEVDAAVNKVFGTESNVLAGQYGLEIAGSAGRLIEGDEYAALGGRMYAHWVHGIALPIAGGTNEIQRNIIAQRGLGLPR